MTFSGPMYAWFRVTLPSFGMGAAYLPRHDAATILKVAGYSPGLHLALALAFVPLGGFPYPFATTFAFAVPFTSADKLVSSALPSWRPPPTWKMVVALSPILVGTDSFSGAIGSISVPQISVAMRGTSSMLTELWNFRGELTAVPSGKTADMTYSISLFMDSC